MIPPQVNEGTPGSERRVFQALKEASGGQDWLVLHSLGIASSWTGEYGEVDFVVVIPKVAIVCIEVKGGKVAHSDGTWTTQRHGAPHPTRLKRSPFQQAQEGMWKLKQAIEAKFGPGSLEAKCPIGWLVVLPDIACPPITPEFTRAEVIDGGDLQQDISSRVKEAPSIVALEKRKDLVPPSANTCKRLLDFLRPNFERVSLVSTDLWHAEQKIQSLTEEQYGVLDAIEDNVVCLIKGAAGTGKTNLALEAAKRFLHRQKRVLLFCYNRNLGNWLSGAATALGQGIVAGHLHGLLRETIERSSLRDDLPQHGETDSVELYEKVYFELGALAIHELGERFDVILVDETQDMVAEQLALLIGGWTDGVASPRVILFGDFIRQALYQRGSTQSAVAAAFNGLPVFNLSINCRNTRKIALQTNIMCGFTGSKVSNAQIDGDPVEVFFTPDTAILPKLEQVLTALRKSGHKPNEIVILGTRKRENSQLSGVGTVAGWRVRDLAMAGQDEVPYSTIHAFKGLEKPVVVVVEAGTLNSEETDRLLYVAMSRARVRLFIICREEAKAAIEKRMVEAIAGMQVPA